MALGETCHFYGNQSVVITKNPATVKEHLNETEGDIGQTVGISLCLSSHHG